MVISTDQRYEYVIQGTVVDAKTRAGIQGVRVEAWDRDTRYHDMLGVATTDAEGRFTIGYQSDYFGDYAPDRAPDLFFKVFLDDRETLNTFDQPMRNVQRGTTTVTLELKMPVDVNKGTDRISGLQALKMVDWWAQSDFRGVYEEGKDKTRTMTGLLKAVGAQCFSGMELKPMRPSATKESQIVGRSAVQAEAALATRSIQVSEVKEAESSGCKNLLKMKDYPLTMKSDELLTLYQKDGVVQYYTRTPKTKDLGAEAERVAAIDADVQGMKAQIRGVETLREEMAQMREDSQATGQLAGDSSKNVQVQAEEIAKLRNELAFMRKDTAEKDAQITKLRSDLDMVRTAQINQTTNIPMSRLEALEKEIIQLRAAPERVLQPQPIIGRTSVDAPAGRGGVADAPGTKKRSAKKVAKEDKPPPKSAARKAGGKRESDGKGKKKG